MLNDYQSMLLMLATVSAAVTFLFLLQRIWPSDLRRQHNDLIGWHVSVLGSTYAVILGFMLFAVWTNFQTADTNAEAEANCLVSVARSSRGLPAEQRALILRLANAYTRIMIAEEWPAMSHGQISPASHPIVQQLWASLISTEERPGLEQTSLDHTMSELARMTEYRRLRQMQVDANLPEILWLVLILGATVTILSACLFGTSDFRLHVIQVIMLSLLISSILVAIGDINRPFQGSVHVGAEAFEHARATLADMH